jgi:hypothetical protein
MIIKITTKAKRRMVISERSVLLSDQSLLVASGWAARAGSAVLPLGQIPQAGSGREEEAAEEPDFRRFAP